MTEENNNRINLALLLPLGLLIIEIIAVVVLLGSGYEISEFLFIFLSFLALFLIYQISRQVWVGRQMKKAIAGMEKAKGLIDTKKPLEAIKQWKKILLNLPQEEYLDVLTRMEKIYDSQEMTKAVQQIRAIQSESIEFFQMTKVAKNLTQKDRRKWQTQAFELQKMIRALPVKKGQDLSDVKPDEQ